jgi:hypothetical protein
MVAIKEAVAVANEYLMFRRPPSFDDRSWGPDFGFPAASWPSLKFMNSTLAINAPQRVTGDGGVCTYHRLPFLGGNERSYRKLFDPEPKLRHAPKPRLMGGYGCSDAKLVLCDSM